MAPPSSDAVKADPGLAGVRFRACNRWLEGDLDLRGFLGLSDQVRKGYSEVRMRMEVDTDAPAETLRELAGYSPVYDIVSGSLPVRLEIVARPG
jgi:hypothetical protein